MFEPTSPVRVATLIVFEKVLRTPLKVLESARRVEEAAVVMVEESVFPSYVRPEPMRSDFTAPVPFPLRMPESVVEPVPPLLTETVEVEVTTPLAAESTPLSEPMVTPPLKTFDAEKVLAVVVENAVVNTPVALLYASG